MNYLFCIIFETVENTCLSSDFRRDRIFSKRFRTVSNYKPEDLNVSEDVWITLLWSIMVDEKVTGGKEVV